MVMAAMMCYNGSLGLELECLEVAQAGFGMITNGAHFRLIFMHSRVFEEFPVHQGCEVMTEAYLCYAASRIFGIGSCWMALSLSKSLPFLRL